tara:strand:+ start:42395 stop:42655 length:261 start_codon:yes stop_codon:yes gene_type:complete
METPPILQSKKFLASALAALISFLGIREGFTSEQIALVVGPLMGFVAMQGVADIGKERAKVEATQPKPLGDFKFPDPAAPQPTEEA